jgi:hypothetical protein
VSVLDPPPSGLTVAATDNRYVGYGMGYVNVRDPQFAGGAKGNGSGDDYPAIAAALAATSGAGYTLLIPRGNYPVSQTVNFGSTRRVTGSSHLFGSTITALTSGMTVATLGSGTIVEDITINGAGIAGWGLKTDAQANKPHLQRVRVEQCVDAGFVHEATQNAVSIDCFSQYNAVNYLLVNGVCNSKWINCNGNSALNAGAGTRSVVVAADLTDARFAGIIYAGGNRNISFIGGIHERGVGDHQIDLTGLAGPVSFIDVELDGSGVSVLHVGPTVGTCRVIMQNVMFGLNSTNLAVHAESGRVSVSRPTFSGKGGRSDTDCMSVTGTAALMYDVDSHTVPANSLASGDSYFQSGPGGWHAMSGATLTHDPVKRRLRVTTSATNAGGRCYLPGTQTGTVVAGRLARVTFHVRDITGSTTVTLLAVTNAGTRPIAAFGSGAQSIDVELVGDETGLAFGAGTATATTFDLCYATFAVI